MFPSTCHTPPWRNIEVTIVIAGQIEMPPTPRSVGIICVTAAGTIANLPTTSPTRPPSESS